MSSQRFEVEVEGIGKCDFAGPGPWFVVRHGNRSTGIVNSDGREDNPGVTGPFTGGRGIKRNANTVFADPEKAVRVKDAANAAWAKAQGKGE